MFAEGKPGGEYAEIGLIIATSAGRNSGKRTNLVDREGKSHHYDQKNVISVDTGSRLRYAERLTRCRTRHCQRRNSTPQQIFARCMARRSSHVVVMAKVVAGSNQQA